MTKLNQPFKLAQRRISYTRCYIQYSPCYREWRLSGAVRDEEYSDTSAIYITNNVRVTDVAGWDKKIQIYPNPTSGILYINSPLVVNAFLYGIDGRLVAQEDQVRSVSFNGFAVVYTCCSLTIERDVRFVLRK